MAVATPKLMPLFETVYVFEVLAVRRMWCFGTVFLVGHWCLVRTGLYFLTYLTSLFVVSFDYFSKQLVYSFEPISSFDVFLKEDIFHF
jgi:hypothetical protein